MSREAFAKVFRVGAWLAMTLGVLGYSWLFFQTSGSEYGVVAALFLAPVGVGWGIFAVGIPTALALWLDRRLLDLPPALYSVGHLLFVLGVACWIGLVSALFGASTKTNNGREWSVGTPPAPAPAAPAPSDQDPEDGETR